MTVSGAAMRGGAYTSRAELDPQNQSISTIITNSPVKLERVGMDPTRDRPRYRKVRMSRCIGMMATTKRCARAMASPMV